MNISARWMCLNSLDTHQDLQMKGSPPITITQLGEDTRRAIGWWERQRRPNPDGLEIRRDWRQNVVHRKDPIHGGWVVVRSNGSTTQKAWQPWARREQRAELTCYVDHVKWIARQGIRSQHTSWKTIVVSQVRPDWKLNRRRDSGDRKV